MNKNSRTRHVLALGLVISLSGVLMGATQADPAPSADAPAVEAPATEATAAEAPAAEAPAAEAPAAEAPAAEAPAAEPAAVGEVFSVDSQTKLGFVAKITGSSFKGESSSLKGTVVLNPAAKELTKVNLIVPADSIETGMKKRDNHMRERYLHTDKFPLITFNAKNVPFALGAGDKGTIDGAFKIHGVEKPAKIDFVIKSMSDTEIVIDSAFDLDIGDYGIKQPKFMVVKMDKLLKMELRLILRKKV